jgi:TonB-linked SusC/RagA family outer membrane protein
MKKKSHIIPFERTQRIKQLLFIMRLSFFLLFLSLLNVSAAIFSQEAKLTLKLQNVTLKKVFDEIEKSSNIKFLYRNELVNVNQKVNVSVWDETIDEILDKIFDHSDLTYRVFENNLVVITNKNLQQKQVTGVVTDAVKGDPLPGVTVLIEGTTSGVTTDMDGKYTISIPNENAVLIFSYVGYLSERIQVSGQSTIEVKLTADIKNLEEIVVVGYGTQKKVNLTGAVGSVKGDVLENRPITNLGQGLQGMIPNLVITQGYAPGQGSSFNVRGITSLNGGGPLILIDGVIQDPNLLNPNDVESVSVLKDAASAAIYGARASYGVILITTKQGKKDQQPLLNVTSSYTTTSATNIPEYADSWSYITYMNTASKNAGGSNYFDQRLMDNAKKYYDDPKNNLPVYYDPAVDLDGKYRYCGNTNWAKELYKSGTVKQVNASISGGSEKTSYFVSYGFLQQNGFLRSYNDQYQRHNINMNLSTWCPSSCYIGNRCTSRECC